MEHNGEIKKSLSNLAKGILVLGRRVAQVVAKLGATRAAFVTSDLVWDVRPGERLARKGLERRRRSGLRTRLKRECERREEVKSVWGHCGH